MNKDQRVIEEFGEEWKKFEHGDLNKASLLKSFDQYFSIFPWSSLSLVSEGFDMGCGSGRWAQFVAPKVTLLNCVEPSDAINVAKNNLKLFSNVRFLNDYQTDYLSAFPFYTENDKKYRFIRDKVLKEKYFDLVFEMMKEKKYSQLQRKEKLFMSVDEIKTLHDSGHTIGLHSHSHPTQIHNLDYSSQLEEYTKNYKFISSITKRKINVMSHPCGNYNDDTLKVLKELGVKFGFRSSLTPSNIKSSLEIPREDHANIMSRMNGEHIE